MAAVNEDDDFRTSRADLNRVFEASGLDADNIVKAHVLFEHAVLTKVADVEDGLITMFEAQKDQLVRDIGRFLEHEFDESVVNLNVLLKRPAGMRMARSSSTSGAAFAVRRCRRRSPVTTAPALGIVRRG